MKILIAEKNKVNQVLLQNRLPTGDFRTDCVESATQAVEVLRQAYLQGEAFDLAIISETLPDMDGLSLAKAVKAEPSLKKTKLLLICTSNPPSEDEAEKSGIFQCLQKPVNRILLRQCLESMAPSGTENVSARPEKDGKKTVPASNDRIARVLLAEDNRVDREFALAMLDCLNCRVDLATNGEEAVTATDRTRYDLALMDCLMPLMNGFEAARQIRKREKEQQSDSRLAIIALTANTMDGDEEKCLAAGMDDYLKKPFTQNQLLAVLRRWAPEAGARKLFKRKSIAQSQREKPPSRRKKSSRDIFISKQSQDGSMDFSVLDKLRAASQKGSKDWLGSVVNSYLRLSPTLLDSLYKAVSSNDVKRAAAAAHGLKSSSANIGATKLAALCEDLERLGRSDSFEKAPSFLEPIMAEYKKIREILVHECSDNAGESPPE